MCKVVAMTKIFIGSPSDTEKERKCIDDVVQEFNQSLGDLLGIKYETVKWETHSSPKMGRPQGIINEQLKIDQCDIFIGVLWMRFGSPSGGISDEGRKFESGTEEEFNIAYSSWKLNGKPFPMIFRSIKKASTKNVSAEQLLKIEKFLSEFSHDKNHPGLYKEFQTVPSFEKQLRMALIQYAISNKMSMSKSGGDMSSIMSLESYGILDVFVPHLNTKRNVSKINSLQKTRDICLTAHSCYSYVAQFGHRFRDIIEKKLQEGSTFKIIASNPWSESSFFASYGEMHDKIDNYKIKDDNGEYYLDCVKIIEHSKCYSVKYKDSINGYLKLREKYGDKIQMRFTKYEMMSSVLLTDEDCYFEPYLPVNLEERYEKGMLTFELRATKTSYLYRHSQKYFNFLWELSDDYDTYNSHVEEYKKILRNKTIMEVKK